MIQGIVLYRKSNGNEVVYTKTENDTILGVVRTKSGFIYPEQSVASIIARGYWDAVYEEVEKHGNHDQKTHGSWASGSGASELSDDEIKDIFYSAKTVEEAYATIASRLGKSMKPQVADLAENEINLYRGVTNVERDVKRLIDGKIKYTEFQTWGQGIYADPTKSRAADYGTVVGLKLSDDAKILKGEMEWDSAVPVTWENDNARVRGTVTSDFVDMSRIKMNPNESGQPNYSIADLKNLYWAAKGYDGFSPHGGEMVLFNGGVLTVDSKSMKTAVQKHGTHDQKTHGNWATGGTEITSLVDKLSEKKTPGFSIDIRTKTSPKDGYIASDMGAEKTYEWEKVKSSRDSLRSVIKDYVVNHAELLDGSGAFFGAWVDEGVLYLDVSRRYASRSEGVRAGFKNEQKAIYDVVNDAYIYMKDEIDDRTEKARDGRDTETSQGDDRSGTGRVRGRDSRGDTGQSLNRHVCLGRYTVVQKHLEGQHDQRTHGNWAGDRYPEDSVKAARDGALEYSYKKGLKHDETIDYKTVVANRARASQIADVYEDLPKFDDNAVDEYEALASEVEEQFDFMTKTLGVKVEFVAEDPYKTSKEMFEDVSQGRLKVLQTETTGAHPLFSDEQNNKFRAVHDYFGHAATGRGFGQDGEEAAWVHHSQMFTENARAALTTETRGQNSFFNNRGKQFADQKVALLPAEYWKVPATFSKRFELYFEAGLVPIIKHLEGEHDQKKHGRWATQGYTAEESEGIARYENAGPTLDDLDQVYDGMSLATDEDLAEFVRNDGDQYDMMTTSYRVDEDVRDSIAERERELGRELTDQERADIYAKVEAWAVKNYVMDNRRDLNNLRNEQLGLLTDPEQLIEPFNEVYESSVTVNDTEGDMGSFEMTSKVAEVTLDGDGIHVAGNIYADGMPVGNFERLFFKEEGKWVVEHKWLDIEEDYQGKGFGKDFLKQAEDYYTAKGFAYIKLMAGLSDGARHWARAGFDWDPTMIQQSFDKLRTASQYAELDDVAQAEFKAIYDRAVDSSGAYPKVRDYTADDFPFPAEFATMGWDRRTIGDDGDYDWAGKRLMEGLVIDYVKPITAEGRNLLAGPIDRDGDGLIYDGTLRERPAPKK